MKASVVLCVLFLVVILWVVMVNTQKSTENLVLNGDALKDVKFQAEIANLSYSTETDPSTITAWAKSQGMVFDPSSDSFTDLNTNTSFICLRKSLGGGKLAVYLGFRGTVITSLANIEEDLDMSLAYFYGTKVSNGFLQSWLALRKFVVTLLARYRPEKVYITGHSLGASIAALAAVDLRMSFDIESTLYTFASPRTGNMAFVDLFRSTLGESYRVEGIDDPVPRFPTLYQGYAHIPTQILLEEGKCTVGGPAPENYPWDISYHFLSTYISLLNSLPLTGCAE